MIDDTTIKPSNMDDTRARLDELAGVIGGFKRLLILTHDNPDPDSIASAAALRYFSKRYCDTQATVAYGGLIGRAENRAMVNTLRLHPVPLVNITWRDYDGLALVDHQPRRGIKRWPKDWWPAIIIDHHPRRRLTKPVPYVDIRKGFGANSTVLIQYLRAANLPIPRFLATALTYGLLSDTEHFSRGTFPDDRHAYLTMFPICSHLKLKKITHPILSTDYIRCLVRALGRAQTWRNGIVTFSGDVPVPDLVSDVADRLVRVTRVRASLAMGVHGDVLHLSLRIREMRRDAGRLIRQLVGRKGSSGGHGSMAGAQINIQGLDRDAVGELTHHFSDRFFGLLFPRDPAAVQPTPIMSAAQNHQS